MIDHAWRTLPRRRLVAALAAGLAVMAGAAPQAWANGNNGSVIKVSAARATTVKIAKGKPLTIRTSAPFYEIVIGDPEIANVNPLTDQSFYILGNTLGTTGIALFDTEKQLVGTIDVEVTLDTERLAATIREAVPGSDIEVDSANGRLVLSGSAEDAVAAEKAKKIATNFSGEEAIINSVKIDSSQQVQLNVRFVEINREIGQELGTAIRNVSYDFGGGSVGFSGLNGTSSVPAGQLITRLMTGGFSIDATIEALEDRGVARRLAEPNLIARSGQTASFLAGGEFPIPVAADDGNISVSYKKFGVGLEFTPTVLQDGLISLDIKPEVSSVDASASYDIGDIVIPGFVVRRAHTSVDLKSGQSFMIAGLLQSQNDINTQRIPGLGKIPILGNLFSSKAYQRRETDLVIIITPHLVKPMDPSMKPAVPSDGTVAASGADYFLGNVDEVKVTAAGGAADEITQLPSHGHFLDLPLN